MKKTKTIQFAEALKELEQINDWFQHEDVDLEKGLSQFRRGMELIKQCRKELQAVENEFEEIQKEFRQEEESAYSSQE